MSFPLPKQGTMGHALRVEADLDRELVAYCESRDQSCLYRARQAATEIAALMGQEIANPSWCTVKPKRKTYD